MKKKFICAALALLLCAFFAVSALGESVTAPAVADSDETGSLSGYVVALITGGWQGDAGQGLTLARVSYVRSSLEAEGASVLLIDTGDSLSGADSDADALSAVVSLMNAAGYDALALSDGELALGEDALSSLKGESGFIMLTDADRAGFGATAVLQTGALRVGLAIVSAGEGEESALSAANDNCLSLKAENCDVVIALCRRDAEAIAPLLTGADILVDMSREKALEEGLWLSDGRLVAAAGQGLEAIGCVAIDPSGYAAAMTIDETWFTPDMIDEALEKRLPND